MKAFILLDNIISNSFKNRLSRYLKDLGLLKKRYNDGYYNYYGIIINNLIYL